ncbi:hypothetical protein ACH5RR_039762 [Cinchona calisaya]|uniref:Leucine-rich repeat-containing N-terminal plant-type domain-containing protein n=1 Tax=Cinchona calisaya TaxID=153742 RepID=A0ABD2XZ84_9GENT
MERHFYCYFLALSLVHYCFIVTYTALKTTNIATDQSALLALKAHITSDPYQFLSRNWSLNSATSSAVCDWIGVECGSKHQRVTALNISSMSLTGTIPPQLGNLTFLVSLNIRNNYFHGNLPLELSHLRRLRFIRLSFNNFTGEIPMWFGCFPVLQFLALSHNNFSGLIPSSISQLSKLKHLNFDGIIPQEIGNLRSLKGFDIGNNHITGSIPKEIGNLTRLTILEFSENLLTASTTDDEAWTTLKMEFQGSSKVITVKLQSFHRDFETLQMKSGNRCKISFQE